MKILSLIFINAVVFFTAVGTNRANAQESTKNIKSILDSKHYTFKAQTVLPAGGQTRQLTSEYGLKVSGDSLISYLPYFGRAYSAPADPTKSALEFNSTNFDYNVRERKGKWNITIKPNDTRDVRQLYLTVFENGNASLQVTSNFRQSISFNGQVVELANR